jgi:2'-5' RNA ligase
MKFFIGIVPPPEVYEQLHQIQSQFGDNRLEPHITIRPPVSPLQLEPWIQVIKSACAQVQPFDIQLTGTGFFGDRVLFVNVQSPGLNNLYQVIIPALRPFEPDELRRGEDGFHPHLTLGRKWCGFTAANFVAMKQLADQYLQADTLAFTITQIRVYYKPDNHGRFETYRDISLSNQVS